MPIEMRVNTDGVVSVVIACTHCGEAIEDVEEGVAVWLVPGGAEGPDKRYIDYSHGDCEDRFLRSSVPAQVATMNKTKVNIPLATFLDLMHEA